MVLFWLMQKSLHPCSDRDEAFMQSMRMAASKSDWLQVLLRVGQEDAKKNCAPAPASSSLFWKVQMPMLRAYMSLHLLLDDCIHQ